MKQLTICVAGLMLVVIGLSQAQITEESKQEEMVDALHTRGMVLNSLRTGLSLQFIVPPQYSQCLFVAYMQSSSNESAHEFLLNQVDFLNAEGLTANGIIGLISYGHAVTSQTYAIRLRKPIDKLTSDDVAGMSEYLTALFEQRSCVRVFGAEQSQKVLAELIAETIKHDE